jgi:threonine aldolase
MKLVEKGKLNLDAPIIKYLPWFHTANKELSDKITIRMLLNNTSGLYPSKATPAYDLPEAAVLTITQPTEYGTVYSLTELSVIAKICRDNNLLLHIDGARIFNALVALNCSLKDLVKASGVDVLTMGGTKSGLMFGEAVIFFNPKRFKNSKYNHKRSMQLASKNRFIATQFIELFREELWKEIASHTNDLGKYFEQELIKIDKSVIAQPVQTNMAFVKMKQELFDKLIPIASFYRWDSDMEEARFAFSFSNTKRDIECFLKGYIKAIKEK